jgi:hypothetical protein
VHGDLERLTGLRVRVVPLPAGEPGDEGHMGRAGNGQKLGGPLDGPEGRGARGPKPGCGGSLYCPPPGAGAGRRRRRTR